HGQPNHGRRVRRIPALPASCARIHFAAWGRLVACRQRSSVPVGDRREGLQPAGEAPGTSALPGASLPSFVPAPPIYLDNAATSWPKPPAVAAAIADYLTHTGATPRRGGYRAATEAGAILDRLRHRLAEMTGATPDRIILNSGATEGINTVIAGLLASGRTGVNFVTTDLEHNAV